MTCVLVSQTILRCLGNRRSWIRLVFWPLEGLVWKLCSAKSRANRSWEWTGWGGQIGCRLISITSKYQQGMCWNMVISTFWAISSLRRTMKIDGASKESARHYWLLLRLRCFTLVGQQNYEIDLLVVLAVHLLGFSWVFLLFVLVPSLILGSQQLTSTSTTLLHTVATVLVLVAAVVSDAWAGAKLFFIFCQLPSP